MMGHLREDYPIRREVRVALCETNPALRGAFQTALSRRGLRDLQICRDSAALLTYLDRELVDLVVCASDLPGPNFQEVMQQIRSHSIGRNPFTVILATISDSNIDQVRRVINAGVDRVASKPLSMANMLNRIDQSIRSRRPFVATDDYMGPTRRGPARPIEHPDEVTEVPNSLRARLQDGISTVELERQIHHGVDALRSLRLTNNRLAIWRSVQRLADHYPHDSEVVARETLRLARLAGRIEQHYRGGAHHAFAEVATVLPLLSRRLDAPPSDKDPGGVITLALLQRLGEVIRQVGNCPGESVAIVAAIAAAVRRFADIPP